MIGIKILLGTSAICALIIALTLLWNENSVSLTLFETKLLETVFVISAILSTKEYSKL